MEYGILLQLVDQQPRPSILIASGVSGTLRIAHANRHADRFSWAVPSGTAAVLPPPVQQIVERSLASHEACSAVPVDLGAHGSYRLETSVVHDQVWLNVHDLSGDDRRRELVALWSEVIDDLEDLVVICDAETDAPSHALEVLAASDSARIQVLPGRRRPTLGAQLGGLLGPADFARLDGVRATGERATWALDGDGRDWHFVARGGRGLLAIVVRNRSSHARIVGSLTGQMRALTDRLQDRALIRDALGALVDDTLARQRRQLDAALTEASGPSRARVERLLHAIRRSNGVIARRLHTLAALLRDPDDVRQNAMVRLDGVLDEAIARLRIRARRLGATVHRSPLPIVPGREDGLVAVFTHLLDLALGAGRAGSVIEVSVTSRRVEGGWRIIFADNGAGLAADVRDALRGSPRDSERYDAVDRIGVAVCRRIVLDHGGRMDVDDVDGAGSSVWFELPESSTSRGRHGLAGADGAPSGGPASGSSGRGGGAKGERSGRDRGGDPSPGVGDAARP